MKVLIVGLGSIARKHIAAIRTIDPAAGIFALRSNDSARREEGVINIFEKKNIPEDIDFIIISNPTSCHADAVAALKGLGKPLFVEKPVFESPNHDELVKAVTDSGLTTYVACNLRFLDGLVFLKKYLSDNPARRINEVNVYCGSHLPDWRPGTDFKASYSAIPELGGGVNLDLIHEIDYVCWLFGKPRQSTAILRNVSSLDIRAVDYANYCLIYPGFVASVILNYYRRDYRRTLEIVFDDDTWTLDLKINTITDHAGNTVFIGRNDVGSTYETQMRYFIDIIKNGRHADNDIKTAYDVLKICIDNERFRR